MNNTMTVFAIRLHAYRLQKNASVAKLANAAGVTRAHVYKIEQGKCPRVGLETALALAEALGVSIYNLLPQQTGNAANVCQNCAGYETAFRKLEEKLRDLRTRLTLMAREI